jgi:hypothetical protein
MTTDSNPLTILGRPDLLRRFNLSLPRAGGSGLEPKWTLRHSHYGFPDIGRVSIIKDPSSLRHFISVDSLMESPFAVWNYLYRQLACLIGI